MGSVPNCRKEIADRYPIRWFKCKLKPPKNHSRGLEQQQSMAKNKDSNYKMYCSVNNQHGRHAIMRKFKNFIPKLITL